MDSIVLPVTRPPSLGTAALILLDSPSLDASGQMALDEVLLESGIGDCVLRVYRWREASRSAVTFGYFQKYEEVLRAVSVPRSFHAPFDNRPVHSRFCCERDCPNVTEFGMLGRHSQFLMVRRPTGGGIVFHDDDVTFSLVFHWDGTLSPHAIYQKIHRGIRKGLMEVLDMGTSLWDGGGAGGNGHPLKGAASPDHADGLGRGTRGAVLCYSKPEISDLVRPDGQKVLGGALRKKRGRVLYQGSLQLPQGTGVSSKAVEGALVRGLAREWGRVVSPEEMSDPLLKKAGTASEKYRSDDWNKKR